MTDDIVDFLRGHPDPIPPPHLPSLYSIAADEIVRLRGDYADMVDRADRAEADADRLAAEVMRLMCACERSSGYRCTKCVALDLHDKEVEAR